MARSSTTLRKKLERGSVNSEPAYADIGVHRDCQTLRCDLQRLIYSVSEWICEFLEVDDRPRPAHQVLGRADMLCRHKFSLIHIKRKATLQEIPNPGHFFDVLIEQTRHGAELSPKNKELLVRWNACGWRRSWLAKDAAENSFRYDGPVFV